MNEFEYSLKGLMNIIRERKLFLKKAYLIPGILILLSNILFYFYKDCIINIDYYDILRVFVSTFSPALITFCGFTMTAYSLVVGFLNYGVFKPTIEKWYRLKIKADRGYIDKKIPKFSIYQNGIALFALAILVLLLSVVFLLSIKFVIDINIEVKCDYIELFNAFILFFAISLSWYSLTLMYFNIINIFTFSQALNLVVYSDELEKINIEEKKEQKKQEESKD